MNHKRDIKKGFTTFVKEEKIGVCPCCDENVYNTQLFAEEDNIIYHYSCYNFKKSDESKRGNKPASWTPSPEDKQSKISYTEEVE